MYTTTEKLKKIIALYKLDFERINRDERYKWEAIGWYKQHWDIEAENFADMLSNAFSRAGNLLSSAMYYPLKMLTDYAKAAPDTVRGLFRMLHDENIPLVRRYVDFRKRNQKCIRHSGI